MVVLSLCLGYGEGLILCQLLPGREFKGSGNKPADYDSKLVQPDASGICTAVL